MVDRLDGEGAQLLVRMLLGLLQRLREGVPTLGAILRAFLQCLLHRRLDMLRNVGADHPDLGWALLGVAG